VAFSSDNVEVFLAVLDNGSFSAAARALGRVPSAVSMTIANLEAELDLNLFDRSSREPKATPAARSLEPQARLLAAQLKALQVQALGLTQGLEERLTLAIAPELLSARWSAPLAALAQEHPLLEVEVLAAPQADALKMLHNGRAQLALVFERPSIDGREGFQEVASELLVAVIAPDHPVLVANGHRLREQHLTTTRQVVVASRDEADPGHPLAIGEAYAAAIPGAELRTELPGRSPLAWQGGQLSRVIAELAGRSSSDTIPSGTRRGGRIDAENLPEP
jgi:DNA-binding transcriptional LysR family regulator